MVILVFDCETVLLNLGSTIDRDVKFQKSDHKSLATQVVVEVYHL